MRFLALCWVLMIASVVSAAEPTYVLSNGVVSRMDTPLVAGGSVATTSTPGATPLVLGQNCFTDSFGRTRCFPATSTMSYVPPTPVAAAPVVNPIASLPQPIRGDTPFGAYSNMVIAEQTACPCSAPGTTACICTPQKNCGSPLCPAVVQATQIAATVPTPMVGAGWTYSAATGDTTVNDFFTTASGPVRGLFASKPVRGMFKRLFGGCHSN